MDKNQELLLSKHPQWRERFLLKRIDEDPIEITLEQREKIKQVLDTGARFIHLGKYTIMLNAMKGIDPVYEPSNIPPKPKLELNFGVVQNQQDVDDWNLLFSPVAINGSNK